MKIIKNQNFVQFLYQIIQIEMENKGAEEKKGRVKGEGSNGRDEIRGRQGWTEGEGGPVIFCCLGPTQTGNQP